MQSIKEAKRESPEWKRDFGEKLSEILGRAGSYTQTTSSSHMTPTPLPVTGSSHFLSCCRGLRRRGIARNEDVLRRRRPLCAERGRAPLSGGALPTDEGIVISLARMNRIIEVDIPNERVVVEPGVTNLSVTNAGELPRLLLRPEPSSQIVCTIGGNVAENSGGVHCLKYGITTNHVLGLEVVLPDGEIIETGGKTPDHPGYDIMGLIVGSEGLLGIVTRVTLRIVKDRDRKDALCVIRQDRGRRGFGFRVSPCKGSNTRGDGDNGQPLYPLGRRGRSRRIPRGSRLHTPRGARRALGRVDAQMPGRRGGAPGEQRARDKDRQGRE